jgi:ribonuclease HI
MSEAIACWWAVEETVAHGIVRVQLETDSTIVQKGITSSEMDQTPAGVIFQDIQALVQANFVHFECFHIPRICNSSAHEIASLGSRGDVGVSEIWEYPLPSFVQNLLAHVSVEQSVM